MDYGRKMRLMQDLREIKDRNNKEYLTSRVRKAKSGSVASSRLKEESRKGE